VNLVAHDRLDVTKNPHHHVGIARFSSFANVVRGHLITSDAIFGARLLRRIR
jgi:hypothetical protein